jgi:hypothetical protein
VGALHTTQAVSHCIVPDEHVKPQVPLLHVAVEFAGDWHGSQEVPQELGLVSSRH